jgi:hypothetical protein
MVLRILLTLGVLLVLAAGGAAGWQYWQTLPQVAEAPVDAPEAAVSNAPNLSPSAPAAGLGVPEQDWLISPGGGLVSRDTAQAFLRQDRFSRDRMVVATFRAPLSLLLTEGEVLPDPVYHQAFADLRAQALAAQFCPILTQRLAQGCGLESASLVDDSYDAATKTAVFRVEMAFTLKPEVLPMPDLTSHVLQTEVATLDALAAPVGAETVQALLASAAESAVNICLAQAMQFAFCRVASIQLDWASPEDAAARISYGLLKPLPQGMYPAPPLY